MGAATAEMTWCSGMKILRLIQLAYIGNDACNCGSSGHGRAHEMGDGTATLPAFKIAIGGRGAALSETEHVIIHGKTHGAAGLTPFKTGIDQYLRNALGLCLLAHGAGAGYDHGPNAICYVALPYDLRHFTQILDPGIGTGADKHVLYRRTQQ